LRNFVEIIKAAQTYIKQLQGSIDKLETSFQARDGDEWREKLALKILDPDDIPQRRNDESIEAYRERLEPILIKRMLNADGSIKKEYQDGPLSDYAQWAQKKFDLNFMRGYVRELEDPNTLPERKNEIYDELEQNAEIQKLVFAEREAAAKSEVQGALKSVSDGVEDNFGEVAQKIDDSFYQLKS